MAAALESPAMIVSAVDHLEGLFRTHYGRVLKAAYRILGNMDDAEDVAQTVFLRLARGDIERDAIRHLESYLHRAAVNTALNLIRSRHDSKNLPLDDADALGLSASDLSPERLQASAELRAWLRRSIGSMHPRTAEMFVLRYLEGYDNRQIAQMMSTSQAVIAVTLHRVRARLQKELRAFMRGRQ